MNIRKFNLFFVTAMFGATVVFNPVFAKSDKANVHASVKANAEIIASTDGLPSGILHAPGIQKRIESGKGLPPGLEKKLSGGDKPDMTAPVIESFVVTEVTANSAVVGIRTNEATRVKMFVSSVSPLVEASSSVFSDTSLGTKHTFVLTGLASSTSYYLVVRIQDSAGNTTTSAEKSFKTEPVDTQAPAIFGPFEISVTKTSAVLIWFTPEKSDSRVWFSTSSTVNPAAAANIFVDSDVFFHSVTLTGLQASTTYHYIVGSSDASGNTAFSGQGNFTTKIQ